MSDTLNSNYACNIINAVHLVHHFRDKDFRRRQWSRDGNHARYCSKLFLYNVVASSILWRIKLKPQEFDCLRWYSISGSRVQESDLESGCLTAILKFLCNRLSHLNCSYYGTWSVPFCLSFPITSLLPSARKVLTSWVEMAWWFAGAQEKQMFPDLSRDFLVSRAARCSVMSCSTASLQGLILGHLHVASLGIPALPFHPALWCLLLTLPIHFLPRWVLRMTKAESEWRRLQQEDVRENEMGSKVTIRKFLRVCKDQCLWTAHPDVRWDWELHLARTLFPFLSQ